MTKKALTPLAGEAVEKLGGAKRRIEEAEVLVDRALEVLATDKGGADNVDYNTRRYVRDTKEYTRYAKDYVDATIKSLEPSNSDD